MNEPISDQPLSQTEFEDLVIEALDALPEFFREKLNNVEVVVADWPSRAELASVGAAGPYSLLGLYQGIPLTQRSHYTMVLPDKITIFKKPIEWHCRTRSAIISQVQRTVLHELAHHFGISDDRLRELGAY